MAPEVILHRMEALGLTRKDLEPMIGSRARISEVLSRKRPLTINLIRKLKKERRIPAEELTRPYNVAERVEAWRVSSMGDVAVVFIDENSDGPGIRLRNRVPDQ